MNLSSLKSIKEFIIKTCIISGTLLGTLALTPSTSAKDQAMYTELGLDKDGDSFVTTTGVMTEKANVSSRLGVSVMHNSEFEYSTYVGINGGVRLYTHNDFTPFVGIGAFTGYHSSDHYLADDDDIDNDNDGSVDEDNEYETEHNYIIGVYPEIGLRYKINRNASISASAQYHVTNQGAEHNFLTYNLGCKFSF